MVSNKYVLRFFFEYSVDECLWAGNDKAYKKFDVGPIEWKELNISSHTIEFAKEVSSKFQLSLNTEYPPDPCLWRKKECDIFNENVKKLFTLLSNELGEEYILKNEFTDFVEDPDLDKYLQNPKAFSR